MASSTSSVQLRSSKTFEEFREELHQQGFILSAAVDHSTSPPTIATPAMDLNYRWMTAEDWSSTRMITSLGQLRAGLCFPLYDPVQPTFLNILRKLQCSTGQLSGTAIRIINEFALRARDGVSLVPALAKEFSSIEYNQNSFMDNFLPIFTDSRVNQEWGVELARREVSASAKELLLDVEPALRLDIDDWANYPLTVQGPCVWGYENGKARTGPRRGHSSLTQCEPWKFRWTAPDGVSFLFPHFLGLLHLYGCVPF